MHTYVCMHACMYMKKKKKKLYVYTYVCACVCVCMHACVCIHACMCVCMCVYILHSYEHHHVCVRTFILFILFHPTDLPMILYTEMLPHQIKKNKRYLLPPIQQQDVQSTTTLPARKHRKHQARGLAPHLYF